MGNERVKDRGEDGRRRGKEGGMSGRDGGTSVEKKRSGRRVCGDREKGRKRQMVSPDSKDRRKTEMRRKGKQRTSLVWCKHSK